MTDELLARSAPSRGRPSRLTPGVQERLVHATRIGASRESAAKYAGISLRTLEYWIRRGRTQQRGKFAVLLVDLRAADTHAEFTLLARISLAAQKDWRAAAWILERRFPKKWGRVETQVHQGDADRPVVFTLHTGGSPRARRFRSAIAPVTAGDAVCAAHSVNDHEGTSLSTDSGN